MPRPLLVNFAGGDDGEWDVTLLTTVVGASLSTPSRLAVLEGEDAPVRATEWCLRGVTSNERYVERSERDELVGRQPPLRRDTATRAALIPIRKSEAWWELTQEERREVFEQRSSHIAVGLEYLPAIARRLHHSRDLGEEFDFLTWFEFAPGEAHAFEELVGRLRQTEEWSYVEREIDVRLSRRT